MSDLEVILEYLKAELATLKAELKKCLDDLDYQGAHLFQKAIASKLHEVDAVVKR